MEELYVEGLASRGGPESCVDVREGVGEALTGVHTGWAIEPRNVSSPGCRRRSPERKAISVAALLYRELSSDPAWSENLCMCGASKRENREIPWLPVWLIIGRVAQGRPRPYD